MERDGTQLAGQRVAFTGRLASMPRHQAAQLVAQRGGQFTPNVNRQTTLLVVGREGSPLRRDGRLTRKLQVARELQRTGKSLEVVPEERFLARLGLHPEERQICGQYGMAELTRLLGLRRGQIESWQHTGLIAPSRFQEGQPCFDFRQVAAAQTLRELLKSGVEIRRIVRSLRQLQGWFQNDEPVEALLSRLLHDGKRIFLRTEAGRLTETNGQFLLEFPEEDTPASIPWSRGVDEAELFEKAVRLEQAGEFEEAAKNYRQLLLEVGPDADVSFNLANVLHSLGEVQAAIERLHETVMLDPHYTVAWNNLGNLLAEQKQLNEACTAYQTAVALEPDYEDAHYGLADVLEQLGRLDEARSHWHAYLQYEQTGPWADYARTRLATHTA